MFDLSKLTEFNPALIYGFTPAPSLQRVISSASLENALFPGVGQHQDMFDAYYFAQQTILPQIKKTGLPLISDESLLGWVKDIHRIIGNSYMQSYNQQSGEYRTRKQNILNLILQSF